jgi:MFS family permease
VLINRNYRLLWIGQTISMVGDFVFDTTLLLWVATVLLRGNPYAPLVSGAVLVVAALTMLLVGPLAGVLVDRRRDKRRIMLAADLLRAGLVGALAASTFLPAGVVPVPLELVLIGLIVVATTAVSQFFNPASFVLTADVVPADQFGRATGYGQATGALAGIVGPPLAAPLLFGVGVGWGLALNALSFLLSYVATRAMRVDLSVPVPAPSGGAVRRGVGQEFAAGLRFIAGQRMLRAMLVSIVVAVLGVGTIQALDVYFVAENLHADPETWFGFVGTAFGVGALVGALVGGRIADRIGPARVYCGSMLAYGVFFVTYSRLTSIGPGLVAVAAFSLSLGVLNTAAMPLLVRLVPREYRGRILSVFNLANRLPELLAMLLSTVLVSTVLRDLDVTAAGIHLGRIDVVFLTGGLLVLAAGGQAVFALRGADRPTAEPGQEESEPGQDFGPGQKSEPGHEESEPEPDCGTGMTVR